MRRESICGALVVLMALPAIVAALPAPGGERSVLNWDKDRTVTTGERYSDCVIELSANLTISGTLSLRNVELVIRSPVPLTRNITVMAGGVFSVLESSRIRSFDPDVHFLLRVWSGGLLQMNDSELRDCGGDPFFGLPFSGPNPDYGLYIESCTAGGYVTITNCTLSNNYIGVILDGGSSPVLMDNDIRDNEWSGIEVYNGCDPTISRNRVSRNGMGLFESGRSRSADNRYSGNGYGVALADASKASFFNDTFSNNTKAGVTGDSFVNPFYDTMVGCRFMDNAKDVVFDEFMQGRGRGELVLENTSYDPEAVRTFALAPILIVKWYLDIDLVYQSSGKPVTGAIVNLTDSDGAPAANETAGKDGRVKRLCLEEYRRYYQTKECRSPYSAHASDGFRSNITDGIVLDRSRELGIVLDDVPPVLEVLYPQDGAPINAETIQARGISEPGVSLTVNGKKATVQGDGNWSVEVALECEGPNQLSALAVDRAGNWAQRDLTVFRDTIPTLLKLWSPADGLVTNKDTVRVAGSTNESSALVTVNGQPVHVGKDGNFNHTFELAEGPNIITVACSDAANNTLTITRTVTRDTVPPALVVEEPADGTVTRHSSIVARGTVEKEAAFTINGVQQSSATGAFEVLVALEEGDNYLKFEARDRAGNVNTSIILVERDNTPPLLVVLSPEDGACTNRSLLEVRGRSEAGASVTVNGVGAKLDGVLFSATIDLLNEGRNALLVEALDALGNRASVAIIIHLDTQAPTIQLLEPQNNTLTNQKTVRLRGQTEPAAVVEAAGYKMTVDKSGNFSGEVALDKEGPNEIRLTARDAVFNTAVLAVLVRRDTEVVYNIRLPGEGARVKSSSLTISGTVEPGATLVLGGKAVTCGPDGSFAAVVPLEPGMNAISLTVSDAAGNVAELSVNVTRIGKATGRPFDWNGAAVVVIALAAAAGVAMVLWRLRKKA